MTSDGSRQPTDPWYGGPECVSEVSEAGQVPLIAGQLTGQVHSVGVHASTVIAVMVMMCLRCRVTACVMSTQPDLRTTCQQPITHDQLHTLHTHTHTDGPHLDIQPNTHTGCLPS